MSNTLESIESELKLALDAQREHMIVMQQGFAAENFRIFQNLQERVHSAELQLKAFRENEESETVGETAVVTIIRAGKRREVVTVPSNYSLRSVCNDLGWDTSELNFQLRVENGDNKDITNIDDPVGTGTKEYFANPKYAAG